MIRTASTPSRPRGKALIALLTASAMLAMGAQALAPAPAAAVMDTGEECGDPAAFDPIYCVENGGGGGSGGSGQAPAPTGDGGGGSGSDEVIVVHDPTAQGTIYCGSLSDSFVDRAQDCQKPTPAPRRAARPPALLRAPRAAPPSEPSSKEGRPQTRSMRTAAPSRATGSGL